MTSRGLACQTIDGLLEAWQACKATLPTLANSVAVWGRRGARDARATVTPGRRRDFKAGSTTLLLPSEAVGTGGASPRHTTTPSRAGKSAATNGAATSGNTALGTSATRWIAAAVSSSATRDSAPANGAAIPTADSSAAATASPSLPCRPLSISIEVEQTRRQHQPDNHRTHHSSRSHRALTAAIGRSDRTSLRLKRNASHREANHG
jgi:hypothetical protein